MNEINMRYHYSAEIETEFRDLLTVVAMTRLFRVTTVTIHQWRKERGLPTIVIPGDGRPAIRFYKPDVLAWAEREGIEVYEALARVPLRHDFRTTLGALPRVNMTRPLARVPMLHQAAA